MKPITDEAESVMRPVEDEECAFDLGWIRNGGWKVMPVESSAHSLAVDERGRSANVKGARVPEPKRSIKRPMFTAVATVLALLWLAGASSIFGQDQLSAAESAAKADAETVEGKKFGEKLGQAFGREHGSTIQRCAKDAKRPDLSDFDLYLRVDGAGVVDQALVKPATTLASCVRDKMPGWKTIVPPHARFWLKVGVNLKGK